MVAMKIERGGRWSAVIGREVAWGSAEEDAGVAYLLV